MQAGVFSIVVGVREDARALLSQTISARFPQMFESLLLSRKLDYLWLDASEL